MKNKYGKIHEKNAMFLRLHVGDATGQAGEVYELNTSMNGSPMVTSNKTGKTFTLSWGDIINMAVDAGVDE